MKTKLLIATAAAIVFLPPIVLGQQLAPAADSDLPCIRVDGCDSLLDRMLKDNDVPEPTPTFSNNKGAPGPAFNSRQGVPNRPDLTFGAKEGAPAPTFSNESGGQAPR